MVIIEYLEGITVDEQMRALKKPVKFKSPKVEVTAFVDVFDDLKE